MAKSETDEKVMAMVAEELKKNPDISVDELQKKASSINKGVSSLTARQFHARYPLQIKRRKAAGSRPAKSAPKARKPAARASKPARRKAVKAVEAAPAAAAAAVDREAVRQAFLRFATDLAAAEARKDLVKVLAGVDKYVDQVSKAAGR